ncbi:MAG: DUF2461 domain-containing protein [Nannocystaceae bacterium]|nr:DUF2461 domain-containing protein [Nannocystaceae bacterium]
MSSSTRTRRSSAAGKATRPKARTGAATARTRSASKTASARRAPTKTAARSRGAAVVARKAAAPASATPARFEGFGADTLAFLRELERHNEREWFEAHRERYEQSVKQPALAFIAAMAPELERVMPSFVADPRPVGGSLMRIHRDVRFSPDKRPYKTNVGIHFRHVVGKDVHAPGVYVHIDPQDCFVGVGLWRPEPEALALIRKRIVERPSEWTAARNASAFRNAFTLMGEMLARAPRGFDPAHPHVDDLRRKDHIAGAKLTAAELADRELPRAVSRRLTAAKAYLQFLCAALDLSL